MVDLIFICEPQIYQCDVDLNMNHLQGEYCHALNSTDKYDPDLPLVKPKAHGGTMVLWKIQHDPYISVHPVSSAAILPVIFNPTNSPTSIHIAVYLPTHGQDPKFMEELSTLEVCIQELRDLFPGAPVYLRGDFNVNAKNVKRSALLAHFCKNMGLTETALHHNTYHHFMGNGNNDSELDKLLFSLDLKYPEVVSTIICKLESPAVDSHHDVIISKFSLPFVDTNETSANNMKAPKVDNNRFKVLWSDIGVEEYQNIVVPELQRIQQQLLLAAPSPGKTLLSLFCESTNHILHHSAISTNKSIKLDKKVTTNSKKIKPHIQLSSRQLLKKHRLVKQALHNSSPESQKLRDEYLSLRAAHRKLVRKEKAAAAVSHDVEASEILSKDPRHFFKRMKSARKGKIAPINKLVVDDKVYYDENVPDGFNDSIYNLKASDHHIYSGSEIFNDFSSDYKKILEI